MPASRDIAAYLLNQLSLNQLRLNIRIKTSWKIHTYKQIYNIKINNKKSGLFIYFLQQKIQFTMAYSNILHWVFYLSYPSIKLSIQEKNSSAFIAWSVSDMDINKSVMNFTIKSLVICSQLFLVIEYNNLSMTFLFGMIVVSHLVVMALIYQIETFLMLC